jgi:hypothetical protein
MTSTSRIAELLHIYETQGFWSKAEAKEAREIVDMGRDPGYMPEGTEGWMEEDGVPRSYDKPKKSIDVPKALRELGERGDHVELSLSPKLDPPPPRPAEPAELRGKQVRYDAATGELTPVLADVEPRIKTLEATVTDLMRRLKALEERVIDPSV